MSRKSQQLWKVTEERWPDLQQFLGCYLHQDWPTDYGSPEAAVDAAIAEYDLPARQAVAREWWDWNATGGAVHDARDQIEHGFGVCVWFETPAAARQFMNLVHDRLIIAVRSEVPGWRADS